MKTGFSNGPHTKEECNNPGGVLKWTVMVTLVRATGTPDSRRILSNITVYNYDTTHLQENPQRLG